MTDPGRAKIAANALKEIETMGKKLGKPATVVNAKAATAPSAPTKVNAAGISEPVAGSGLLQIVMYTIAGILVLGIVLMVVDRWFYPIFKVDPGAPGFVIIPGTDTSDQFWTKRQDVRNIRIGTSNVDTTVVPQPLSSIVLEGKTSYSITMDIFIDENQFTNIPPASQFNRTFFMIAPAPTGDKQLVTDPGVVIKAELNRDLNKVQIVCMGTSGLIQTAVIDNVPMHKPFRIGIVKTLYSMAAYLNGELVQTIKIKSISDPVAGQSSTLNPGTNGTSYVIAPQNIVGDTASPPSVTNSSVLSLSKGIQVLNLRLFEDNISPSEMKARMSDLTDVSEFKPPVT
jgi:hypothetical protein